MAQTLTDDAITQSVCIGIEDYEIVPNINSAYTWSIINLVTGGEPGNGEADITPVTTSPATTTDSYIQVNFTSIGSYKISVLEIDANLCQGVLVELTIIVNPFDDASFTLTDYCVGSSNSANITGTQGGVFTFTTTPTGIETINGSTGEITDGVSGTTYSVTYTTPGPDCPESSIESVTVNPLDDASFTLTDYCVGSSNSANITGTQGGVFTFTTTPTGIETINGSTGGITDGVSGTTYSVTYTTPGPDCSVSSIESVTIYTTPVPGPIWHN